MALTDFILPRVNVTFHNIETMLRTFDPEAELFGMPLWKHAYHLLHSCDRWFVNPGRYDEPPFHTPGLNSLDDPVFEPHLSREDLLAYHAQIRAKCLAYLETLRDEDWVRDLESRAWTQAPERRSWAPIELLLGQFRHIYAHLGNINAVTMQQTGRWPRVVGLEWQISDELWE